MTVSVCLVMSWSLFVRPVNPLCVTVSLCRVNPLCVIVGVCLVMSWSLFVRTVKPLCMTVSVCRVKPLCVIVGVCLVMSCVVVFLFVLVCILFESSKAVVRDC